MSRYQLALLIGASMELLGIVLVGSPELFPQAARASRWLSATWQSIVGRARRLVGRQRPIVVQAGAAMSIGTAGSIIAVKTIPESETLERKLQHLLAQDVEAQQRLGKLENQLSDVRAEAVKLVGEMRDAIRQETEEKIRAAMDEYRALKTLGAVLLVVGLFVVLGAALAQ